MKKILFPLMTLVILFSGCKKDPDIINIYNQGAYVYTEYPKVAWNQWIDNRNPQDAHIEYMYHTYTNQYIDENLINNSFVLTYWIDENNRDIPLPYVLRYYSADGAEHKAIVRYDVDLHEATFIVEALDGDYDLLHNAIADTMCFKVCMMQDPQ